MAQNLTAHNFDWLTFTGQSLSGNMMLVPGYCTIVPRNLSVRFHRWNGFQWAISEGTHSIEVEIVVQADILAPQHGGLDDQLGADDQIA